MAAVTTYSNPEDNLVIRDEGGNLKVCTQDGDKLVCHDLRPAGTPTTHRGHTTARFNVPATGDTVVITTTGRSADVAITGSRGINFPSCRHATLNRNPQADRQLINPKPIKDIPASGHKIAFVFEHPDTGERVVITAPQDHEVEIGSGCVVREPHQYRNSWKAAIFKDGQRRDVSVSLVDAQHGRMEIQVDGFGKYEMNRSVGFGGTQSGPTLAFHPKGGSTVTGISDFSMARENPDAVRQWLPLTFLCTPR